jgi:hypothetical protein
MPTLRPRANSLKQKVLAASQKLKVWPPLTGDEKSLLK